MTGRGVRPSRTAVAIGVIALAAVIFTIVSITSAQTPTPAAGQPLLVNGDFEGGMEGWAIQNLRLTIVPPSYDGAESGAAARLQNTSARARGALFQDGLTLLPNTRYELRFWAMSPRGHNVQVALLQGQSPFANYGLDRGFNVTQKWREFSVVFTTQGFEQPVSDARLSFSVARGTLVQVRLDDVTLIALDPAATATPTATTTVEDGTPTPSATPTDTPQATATATETPTPATTDTATPTTTATATPTATATATATPSAASPTPTRVSTRIAGTATPLPALGDGDEILVFNWDRWIILSDGGFAQDKPVRPEANGDWTRFDGGTLYFRAHVYAMPVEQPGMKLGWCFWQQTPQYAEECSPNPSVPGVPDTDLTWQLPLDKLNLINGSPPIDWSQPRWKHGFVVRNVRGKPVTNKAGFNWSGEDPANWYPMDIHYTVVLVAPGGSFSGWQNYGW